MRRQMYAIMVARKPRDYRTTQCLPEGDIMASANPIVTVSVDLIIEERGDHWAGVLEQLGITVYGDSEKAAMDRVGQMLDFVAGAFQKHHTLEDFRAYLDAHGVQHSVTTPSTAPTVRRYRREEVLSFA